MSLNGKVAVVTGGAGGIGRAISLQLARDGAAVSVWDLNADGVGETVAMIHRENGRAIACIGDCSDMKIIRENIARTRGEFGPITILVNNAGIFDPCGFENVSEERFDRMLDINLKGPYFCTQMIIPDMLAAGWGRIVNISSSSAQTGGSSLSHYAASKGGIIGFTKALAIEYAAKGITVNNIPPGFVRTPMLENSPTDIDAFAATTPMKRAGAPEDIAAACSYLVSEAARYVTGHTLSVNGGRYSN
jgi:2-hydroxycyclohexanecarboxyl-CoA dehydrogenase